MPPLPKLRVPALAEIARQLRYVPPKAARRQLEAAEAMAGDLDPAATYPEDWVVFRLTGYRPEMDRPALIAGAELIADLSPLIEHLCVAAELAEGDLGDPAGWMGARAVCERWGVSRKTLDRCRREGLLARRVAVVNGSARHKIVFAAGAVEAFERAQAGRLGRAAEFSRIDAALEERIARRAARYRLRLGWSLGQVAARLAERHGRGKETIRQLILRNDRPSPAGGERLFARKGPLKSVQREIIERAYDRGCGVEAAELARRHGVSAATVYRVLAERRSARLREWAARAPASGAGGGGSPSDERALAHPSAREGLGVPGPRTLAALLAFVESAQPEGPRTESARAAAYIALREDALRRIERLLRADPAVADLDLIETRLRWAARLKAEMVRSQLPLAVKTVEGHLGGRAMGSLPARAAQGAAAVAIGAVIEGVERFDPAKGGRLAAPVGLALNRAVSAWARDEGTRLAPPPGGDGRAAARPDPAAVALEDFTLRVAPWQAWLEPDARVRAGLARVPADLARLLVLRYGWGGAAGEGEGGPPRTLAELAAVRGVTPGRVSRLVHRAMRLALGLPATIGGGGSAGAGRG